MIGSSNRAAFERVAPALFVCLWSTGYVGARFGLPFVEPMTLTAMRFAIVVALLGIIVQVTGRRLPRSRRMWGHLAVSGVLIHAGFIGGIFVAIDSGIDIGIAALIAGVQPLLTALVSFFLIGEFLSPRQWAGFVVGFFGLGLVVLQGLALGALPLAGCVDPEWDEQEPGLVVVGLVLVDNGDVPFVGIETRPQTVDHHGPGRPGPEHQQFLHVSLLVVAGPAREAIASNLVTR